MNRDDVMRWVARYEDVWGARDPERVPEIFSADVTYWRSPYDDPLRGIDAVKAFWLDDDDQFFTMEASVVAVDGDDAVVRAQVRYGDPVHQEYRDLWVLHFRDDGRVDHFEEWPYWPDKPYAASAGDAE
jgi:ketosteroid isomerase-like protein